MKTNNSTLTHIKLREQAMMDYLVRYVTMFVLVFAFFTKSGASMVRLIVSGKSEQPEESMGKERR